MAENYRHLPYIDFRPYAVGTNLREAIAKEEASLQRVLLGATKYIYSKDGKTKAFEASALPR